MFFLFWVYSQKFTFSLLGTLQCNVQFSVRNLTKIIIFAKRIKNNAKNVFCTMAKHHHHHCHHKKEVNIKNSKMNYLDFSSYIASMWVRNSKNFGAWTIGIYHLSRSHLNCIFSTRGNHRVESRENDQAAYHRRTKKNAILFLPPI